MQLLPYNKFGNGKNGNPSSATGVINTYATMTASSGGQTVVTTLSVSVGDVILLIQSQGTGAGNWELVTVKTVGSGQFDANETLVNNFVTGAQAIKVPQYTGGNLSGSVTCNNWNGSTGGVVALMSNGELTISGIISVNGNTGTSGDPGGGAIGGGFRGGDGKDDYAYAGEGYLGVSGVVTNGDPNGNGGGGGNHNGNTNNLNINGAGGGNANSGESGNNGQTPTTGGLSVGNSELTVLFFGGGGGGSAHATSFGGINAGGGSGAGIIVIFAKKLTVTGNITANGGNGYNCGEGVSGSGAGGSILIKTTYAILGTGLISAVGGGNTSGDGSVGRIHVDYLSLVTGATTPTLDSDQDTNLKSSIHGGII